MVDITLSKVWERKLEGSSKYLTDEERGLMRDREEILTQDEKDFVDEAFENMFQAGKANNVHLASTDLCAKVEAALIRFVIQSRIPF